MNHRHLRLGFVWVLLSLGAILSCSDENTAFFSGVDDTSSCVYHSDCPGGTSCNPVSGQCEEDLFADGCYSDADCPSGYHCIERDNGENICSPDDGLEPTTPSDGDAEQEDSTERCLSDAECPPGSECDTASGICVTNTPDDDDDDVIDDDDDDVIDDDDDDLDGDVPLEDGDNDAPLLEDGDLDEDLPLYCQADAHCPEGMICDADGICIEDCTYEGCEFGTCNEETGHCEFCEPLCQSGTCCNYAVQFWYCGSCCVPACGDGMVCSQGECIEPSCPADCPRDNCHTCGPETGWLCEEDPSCFVPDGDAEGSESGEGGACLSPGSGCQQGMDECCSGVCLLGTCL